MSACGDDEQVDCVVWELIAEPVKVFHVGIPDAGCELHLDSEDRTFDDQIDFVIAVAST
jgi:hypothetical protein